MGKSKHPAAKEPDILLRRWRRPKQSKKESQVDKINPSEHDSLFVIMLTTTCSVMVTVSLIQEGKVKVVCCQFK